MDEPMSNLPKARTQAIRQISIVWIVPIVALLVGLWMIYDTFSKRGPEITLSIENAEGIEADKTIIKVLNVTIGKVSSVSLDADNQRVIMKARLNAGTESLLREDTQFWVIKPRFDKGKVSGLSTLLSGAYIQLEPGKAAQNQSKFTVLANPPITAANVPGLRIKLTSSGVKALSIGDPVLFESFPVGRIESLEFDLARRAFIYSLFIEEAYAALVTENTRFWNSSGIEFKTGLSGLKLNTGSLESIISGGVAFDVRPGLTPGEPSKNQALFTLYPDKDSIIEYSNERHIEYLALFHSSVRGLAVGSPVEYRGLRVGSVVAVPYLIKESSHSLFEQKAIPILFKIEMGRIENFVGKYAENEWAREVNKGIGQGLTARLKSGNLVTGSVFIDIDFDKKIPSHKIASIDGLPVIPTSTGGFAQIENKVDVLLDKLNALPLNTALNNISATAENADQLIDSLKKLSVELEAVIGQPEVKQLPRELQQTLTSLRTTLDGLSPQSATHQELNRLLRELRPVVRTLNEKPNALIFAPKIVDEEPKESAP